MLIELQKVLSVYATLTANDLKQGVFVCEARLPQSYWIEPYQNLRMCVSYIFIALEINKYVLQKCILYRNLHILHIQYIHTLHVCMSTSGIIIHFIGGGYQSPNPQEIHCFK